MDGNLGGSKVSEGMSNKDNCGAAGTKELNILPTKCKPFLFDMGISTANFYLSNELGELATTCQAWNKLTADKNQSAGRPASQITNLLKCATTSEIHSRLKMGQVTRNQETADHALLRLWIQGTRTMDHGGEGAQKRIIRI
jgi:hypothetical protein